MVDRRLELCFRDDSKPEVREQAALVTGIERKNTMSNSKLYVGNMAFATTESDLRDAFGQFGTVSDVYVAMDKFTGRARGFAFVTMSTPEEAKIAIEKLHGQNLGGRALTVNEARPKEEGAGRSFGGGGGDRGSRGGFGGGDRGSRGGFGGGDRGERRY
jgi:cold-inducible RNA-binding protein